MRLQRNEEGLSNIKHYITTTLIDIKHNQIDRFIEHLTIIVETNLMEYTHTDIENSNFIHFQYEISNDFIILQGFNKDIIVQSLLDIKIPVSIKNNLISINHFKDISFL